MIDLLTNLGIEHDGAKDASVEHSLTEVIESLLVVLMRSVREVKPSDVHASPEKLLHHLNGSGSGAKGAHDLRLRPLLYHRHR